MKFDLALILNYHNNQNTNVRNKHDLTFRGSLTWNSLPSSIKSTNSTNSTNNPGTVEHAFVSFSNDHQCFNKPEMCNKGIQNENKTFRNKP